MMVKAEINIDIEGIAQDALMKFAQAYYEKHGIRITCVDFNWYDIGLIDGSGVSLTSCQIRSIKRRG